MNQNEILLDTRNPGAALRQLAACQIREAMQPVFTGAPGCTVEDNRSDEQKKTHILAVVATDKGMSGWGGARGGLSKCAWAFDPAEVNSDRVENWVRARSDMSWVALVDLRTYRASRRAAHFHIYVCGPDHVAAKY